ncbi:hypothetical protein EJA71_03010 [Pseudomonas sp. PB106]|nr:hypothetical protein EJA71_03010 [Pseudomonas sp. PB106]
MAAQQNPPCAGFVLIVPTLCVGMPLRTVRVRFCRDAERPRLHAHAERGNDQDRSLRQLLQ